MCETSACAERQIAGAMLYENAPDGQSPYLFLPLPFQVDIETAIAKKETSNLLVAGAAGTSKSYFGRWHLYKWCKAVPGFRAMLLRCTYDQLDKNHLQYMPAEQTMIGAKYTGGNVRQMLFSHANGPDSVIRMGYCDDETDIIGHMGQEWDRIVFEEASLFLPKALNQISSRSRGSATARRALDVLGMSGGSNLYLSNPGGRAMLYLRDFFIDREPDIEEYPKYQREKHGFLTSTLDDNPYLHEDYEANNLSHLSKARYMQLRHGDWSTYAGQFFGSFDSTVHVQELAR